MQTAGGVDDDHVGILGHGRLHRVESHGSGVSALTLLHNRNSYPISPDLELTDGGGTEGVRSTQHDLLASVLEVVGQLADGGCLAHAVHTHNHDDIRLLVGRDVEGGAVARLVLLEQAHDLLFQYGIELAGAHVFVAGHARLYALDNLQGGLDAHVGGDEDLLKVVEHLVVDGRLANDGFGNAGEDAGLGLFKSFIEVFLVFYFLGQE